MSRPRRILWLDLGTPGAFVFPSGPMDKWQDHGLGLLRTLLHQSGTATDLASVRAQRSWSDFPPQASGYDVLLMNVRSYTFPTARTAARLFKEVNPRARVIVGGMHATVAAGEMLDEAAFDHICVGSGEAVVAELVQDPSAFPRRVTGAGTRSMDQWPVIDRRLWPDPGLAGCPWPLEPDCGWGPPPVATILTSRVCPWRCSFCNEAAYIAHTGRRSVDSVIDELNFLDRRYGPLGSVVVHDSMFFQNPSWLTEWLEKYPARTRAWPYWAAARSDTVRRWPELFRALVSETHWNTISIGFESGSDRVLRILNKECTADDNAFTIELVNELGDAAVKKGAAPPRLWANIMLGIPGETRQDAFATMAMLQRMKYRIPSVSFYAPYPGSALGHQLIAEGRSLLGDAEYHRNPTREKVRGVDYHFYQQLLDGRYQAEIDACPRRAAEPPASGARPSAPVNHKFYLFELAGGGRKLGYGSDPADALAGLRDRLTAQEMAAIDPTRYTRVRQAELPTCYATLA